MLSVSKIKVMAGVGSVDDKRKNFWVDYEVKRNQVKKRKTKQEMRLKRLHDDFVKAQAEYEKIITKEQDLCERYNVDVPSFTSQHPWESGFLGMPAEAEAVWFNPTWVANGDGYLAVVRRAKHLNSPKYDNSLVGFTVGADMKINGQKEIKVPPRFRGEHFEDPRLTVAGSNLWLSCCSFIFNPRLYGGMGLGSFAHQVLFMVNRQLDIMGMFDPVYGKNFSDPGVNEGHEKNWVWFPHNGEPHMIYWALPHQVVHFSEQLAVKNVHKTFAPYGLDWVYGEPRGGTPPVLVNGEYWTFFHSSTPWTAKPVKNRYHMGVYAFESRPPFRITRFSPIPLLSGSKEDPWFQGCPLVIFPGGAIFNAKTETWEIIMGINDCACGWIKIPHSEILKRAKRYEPVETLEEKEKPAPASPAAG